MGGCTSFASSRARQNSPWFRAAALVGRFCCRETYLNGLTAAEAIEPAIRIYTSTSLNVALSIRTFQVWLVHIRAGIRALRHEGMEQYLLEGEVEGPEEACQLAYAGGQGLHLGLGQPPAPHLAAKGQPRHEAQVLLEHPQVHLTLCLHGIAKALLSLTLPCESAGC